MDQYTVEVSFFTKNENSSCADITIAAPNNQEACAGALAEVKNNGAYQFKEVVGISARKEVPNDR